MFGINSLFSSKNRPHSPNISRYPSRQYKQVLCSRSHCSDSCRKPVYDPYKYWAVFLASPKINREELLANISTLPEKLRNAVYLHVLAIETGPLKEFNEDYKEYNRAPEVTSATTDNIKIEEDQISKDSQIVRDIMNISGFFLYENPETAFKVYRSLEDNHILRPEIVKCIIPLLSLYGGNGKSTYNIIDRLIRYHGLLDGISKEPPTVKIEDEEKPGGVSEIDNNKNDNNDVNTIVDNNSQITNNKPDNMPIKDNEDTIMKNSHLDNKVTVDSNVLYEVWKIILEEKIDVFFNITDLVISLGCTYKELIDRAAEISLYVSSEKIVAVLSSKKNNHYYNDLLRVEGYSYETNRNKVQSQTYFDFLIVQNELIKGQENIKQQLCEEIETLEEKNRILKEENENLRESLFYQKQNVKEEVLKKGVK